MAQNKNKIKKWAVEILKDIKRLPRYAPGKYLSYREVCSMIKKRGKGRKQK